ncbi:hypothetical protein [Ligilactobacillus acidipiscis]|uniref:hypothetical protein n=1 Tax=Ligilactobacillus acidipiscis TaxID=89059 RepID=UPI0023F7A477|nr:hypothetical protein [Ligilactobacillus acidipiscis]WEV56143.1 hypothetical protein OZX66_07755 [Ligilactobacillus acidipiscis]
MKKELFHYVESIIRDYPEARQHISDRENELTYKFNEFRDENVGGGRPQFVKNEGVANMAVKIADDKELVNLRRNMKAVRNAFEEADEDTKEIIESIYFVKRPEKTIDGIAQDIGLSRTLAYKKRRVFMEVVAENRGLI